MILEPCLLTLRGGSPLSDVWGDSEDGVLERLEMTSTGPLDGRPTGALRFMMLIASGFWRALISSEYD